ncbi:hypothetical protein CORC01_01855 [Colletotrichum orchidophilum]|uniref:Uncharacterized protein n=1 Tax=Colletotrichum orchidophilum TaxID=1209926 RepID=A0A1G4BMX0_9PEZI|nr:uncharacterized protein CORC01_01855 [Colletotrichum orchidophilum]OHF02754.1 hypothetical protein CORC01_01855 [Colletotrichum orchidophilum]
MPSSTTPTTGRVSPFLHSTSRRSLEFASLLLPLLDQGPCLAIIDSSEALRFVLGSGRLNLCNLVPAEAFMQPEHPAQGPSATCAEDTVT